VPAAAAHAVLWHSVLWHAVSWPAVFWHVERDRRLAGAATGVGMRDLACGNQDPARICLIGFRVNSAP
jgi:hypothetical protein